jgi:hypothetical protein
VAPWEVASLAIHFILQAVSVVFLDQLNGPARDLVIPFLEEERKSV